MPAEITLPAFLEERLRTAPHKHVVQKALENFSDWFRTSRLPFFPDYTDHGIQHMEQVLETAAKLIPDTARPHFSGADAAALILAVLFHDSALHLTEAGFHQLIKGTGTAYTPIRPFDTADWTQTWADFMFLARRWDDAKLVKVFGGDNGVPTATVQDPFAHWHNLTRTDYLLIGEFIRQHHPRLAHEMARHGVPGVSGQLLKLEESLPSEWRDLVGLIARSHGLPLRTCLDYLKTSPDFGEEARRDYQGVHAVYLMALLRVADYFQIDSNRTSSRIFEYKKIYSGVSEIEHKAHQAVRNITSAGDPEALFIQAKPEEVAVFLRLKEWLAGIQQELDSSWAVLGEVYGRSIPEGWDKLGLSFRRVRSNLDDVAEFAKTVPYVPDRIRFDVARAELLKLLIGPLYGDDPSYGVRELMQNSIDAVREYDQFVLDNPEYAKVPRREQEADVVVELGPFDEEKGYAVMTISDRGIGMTEATIRDYFLRAGASYRQSPQWKSTFELDTTQGAKSKVLRSGRFGVGALAAFLIGEEIQVETRHVLDESGYIFKTTLNTEAITVIHEPRINVGTRLEIQVDSISYTKLLKDSSTVTRPAYWDWYRLTYPKVQRIYHHPKKGRVVEGAEPLYNIALMQDGWRKLELNEAYEVYWCYNKAPYLTCNGIYVTNSGYVRNVLLETVIRDNSYEALNYPSLFIIDPDGAFPLNLQRNALRTKDYPFGRQLIKDVLAEGLAKLFFNGPTKLNSAAIPMLSDDYQLSDGIQMGAIVANSTGYCIECVYLLDNFDVSYVLFYDRKDAEIDILQNNILVVGNALGRRYSFAGLYVTKNTRNSRREPKYYSRRIRCHPDFEDKDVPSFVADNQYQKEIVLSVEKQKGPWLLLSSEECPVSNFELLKWPSATNLDLSGVPQNGALEERFYPEGSYLTSSKAPWLLDELWEEHFGKDWIPFALEDRIKKFRKAADFFAERYPQVVPDEAWALLGGKPATQQ